MLLKVGKIVNVHALKGELKIISTSDSIEERLNHNSVLYITKRGEIIRDVKVASSRKYKGCYYVKFLGIDSIDEAEKYKNCELKIDSNLIDDLENNEYYFYQIINSKVYDEKNNNLGVITNIFKTGANDVWEMKDDNNNLFYIPFIEEVVKKIDVNEKKITINVIEGLLN